MLDVDGVTPYQSGGTQRSLDVMAVLGERKNHWSEAFLSLPPDSLLSFLLVYSNLDHKSRICG